jgi:hypothetical protein
MSKRLASRIPLVVLLMVAVTPIQAQTRDSAGVRIHTYQLQGKNVVTLSQRPDIIIADTTACFLKGLLSVSFLRDGGIAVVKSRPQVCIFSSQGKLLRTVGREGQGPGEYMLLRAGGVAAGDTIVVMEAMTNKVSVHSPDGSYITSSTIAPPARPNPGLQVGFVLSDGVLAGYTDLTTVAQPSPKPVSASLDLIPFDRSGKAMGRPVRVSYGDFVWIPIPKENGSVSAQRLPFGRDVAVSPFEKGFIAGDENAFELSQFDRKGSLIASHRWEGRRRPVESEDIDALKADTLEITPPREHDWLNKLFRSMEWPKLFPAYRGVAGDPGGRIWVGSYLTPRDSVSHWTILDPKLGKMWEVRLPERLQLLAVSRTHACARSVDENGSMAIKCYRYSIQNAK